MSMSTHIVGFIPPDAEYNRMREAWLACEAAGVEPPKELLGWFGKKYYEPFEAPDAEGAEAEVEKSDAVTKWRDSCREGYQVDLRKLDPKVKILRFYNSW